MKKCDSCSAAGYFSALNPGDQNKNYWPGILKPWNSFRKIEPWSGCFGRTRIRVRKTAWIRIEICRIISGSTPLFLSWWWTRGSLSAPPPRLPRGGSTSTWTITQGNCLSSYSILSRDVTDIEFYIPSKTIVLAGYPIINVRILLPKLSEVNFIFGPPSPKLWIILMHAKFTIQVKFFV